MRREVLGCALLAAFAARADAQMATVGAGVLITEGPAQPAFELHVATRPMWQTRAYATFSWTDESISPVIIAAAERRIVNVRGGGVGLGAGVVMPTETTFDAVPIVVSSSVVPLGIPRTSIVAIASTAPFDEFQWSLVLKASVLLWFMR